MSLDVRMFTLGPLAENAYLVRREDADHAVLFDPGDDAPKLLAAIEELGVQLDAILLTHTHFDHVGAVTPVARATGAPVWCPELETAVLADIMSYVPWPGFGPYESYEADHTVRGGEQLTLAGIDFEVLSTPGHSPGHVTWAVPEEAALFSGDVLFEGSIGRTDLPGGDALTLMRSIRSLLERFEDARVYPGHMGLTTLARERRTNPFLTELQSH